MAPYWSPFPYDCVSPEGLLFTSSSEKELRDPSAPSLKDIGDQDCLGLARSSTARSTLTYQLDWAPEGTSFDMNWADCISWPLQLGVDTAKANFDQANLASPSICSSTETYCEEAFGSQSESKHLEIFRPELPSRVQSLLPPTGLPVSIASQRPRLPGPAVQLQRPGIAPSPQLHSRASRSKTYPSASPQLSCSPRRYQMPARPPVQSPGGALLEALPIVHLEPFHNHVYHAPGPALQLSAPTFTASHASAIMTPECETGSAIAYLAEHTIRPSKTPKATKSRPPRLQISSPLEATSQRQASAGPSLDPQRSGVFTLGITDLRVPKAPLFEPQRPSPTIPVASMMPAEISCFEDDSDDGNSGSRAQKLRTAISRSNLRPVRFRADSSTKLPTAEDMAIPCLRNSAVSNSALRGSHSTANTPVSSDTAPATSYSSPRNLDEVPFRRALTETGFTKRIRIWLARILGLS